MVAVGLRVVEPLAAVDVKVPGVMAMDVAPLVVQASVADWLAVIEVGVAVNEEMAGGWPAAPGMSVDRTLQAPDTPTTPGSCTPTSVTPELSPQPAGISPFAAGAVAVKTAIAKAATIMNLMM